MPFEHFRVAFCIYKTAFSQTLEMMVLATVASTQEATTPLSCFIFAQLSVRYFFITSCTTPTLAKNY